MEEVLVIHFPVQPRDQAAAASLEVPDPITAVAVPWRVGCMMRILIADHRTVVRAALSLLLGQQPGVEVQGIARDSAELLAQVEAVRPDVVLLEWDLPGKPAADLLAALHAPELAPKVIVLALREEMRSAALAAGADAFASKDEHPEKLVAALRSL